MNKQTETPETELDENRLIAERRSKLAALREKVRLIRMISGKIRPAVS